MNTPSRKRLYVVGSVFAVLLLTVGISGGPFADTGADSPDVEYNDSVSGAEYPPSIDDETDNTTDTETDSEPENETESIPEHIEQYGVVAEPGHHITHEVVYDGTRTTPIGDIDLESQDENIATLKYTISHEGNETQEFRVDISVEPHDDTGVITTRYQTHTLEPGETITVTLSIDITDYTDE